MEKLSIVASLYRSTPHLREFISRISASAASLECSVEIILVNDGCPVDSLACARQLQTEFPAIQIVELTRNFGHHFAMMSGLRQASGQWIYLTDVDLEEPPEILAECWARHLEAPHLDWIVGIDSRKKGSLISSVWSQSFHYLFNAMSETRLRKNFLVSRLMSRSYVQSLIQVHDRVLFIGGVWEWVGFRSGSVNAKKHLLPHSSNYSLAKKVKLAVDAITSFSAQPLFIIFRVGVAIAATSTLALAILIGLRLTRPDFFPGWVSIVAIALIFLGVALSYIGTIGIYLAVIFTESKDRPRVIVRQTLRF